MWGLLTGHGYRGGGEAGVGGGRTRGEQLVRFKESGLTQIRRFPRSGSRSDPDGAAKEVGLELRFCLRSLLVRRSAFIRVMTSPSVSGLVADFRDVDLLFFV